MGVMFVRRKPNKSGSISVHIVQKHGGKYRLIHAVGCSSDTNEIARLEQQAQRMIPMFAEQHVMNFMTDRDRMIADFLHDTTSVRIRTVGPEMVLGSLFDSMGFSAIPDELFRHIVVTRLVYPTSKLKTVDYLERYKGVHVDISKVYRFLDTLHKTYKKTVERIAFRHTKKVIQTVSVVFYDMTTLYFEAEDEDDLRKIGFSKDGKFQHPQIMLGLLVGEGGFPIGYDVFKGNTSEGKTLIPTLKSIAKKYAFGKPIVVADAGLLSKDNLQDLQKEKYTFILGARIKNESDAMKKDILTKAKDMKDGDSIILKKQDGTRLIITYSDKRAKKDSSNREKGIRKLRLRVKTGKLTKDSINNRGYNKFLTLTGDVAITIDEEKVQAEGVWDGLKGYVTNTRLGPKRIVENYSHLWQIEKAFRISKTDLRVRPIHHHKERRIKAHICIAFVAYALYKELERQLQRKKIALSAQRAIELTQTIYELTITLPDSQKEESVVVDLTDDQSTLIRAAEDW